MDNKEVFNKIEKYLLEEEKPSNKLNELIESKEMNGTSFSIIRELKDIPQEPKYHPEGNVWNHIMLVVDEAAVLSEKSANKRVLMWGALLHDIGKIKTTVKRKGRWTSYDHDTVGAEMVIRLLREVEDDQDFIDKVSKLVKYHMHYLYVEKNLPFGNPRKLVEETSVEEIALLSYADRCGRGNLSRKDREETKEAIDRFRDKLNNMWSLC